MKYLVVGAGFAGATVARELADAGHTVVVIDKRDHIAGNAHDYINEAGIRVHTYGPHLWHTSNDEVHAWASRFTEWVPYQHRVRAQLADGRTVPLPINPETVEEVFGNRFDAWADKNNFIDYDYDTGAMHGYLRGAHQAFIESLIVYDPEDGDGIGTSLDHVYGSVGQELCDLFFAPYTKKMWGLTLDELPASVAARIPTNVESGSDLYFPKDTHQYLPKDGYTEMFANILKHPNIRVLLNTSRREIQDPLRTVYYQMQLGLSDTNFDHVFTSEPIDTFFNCALGELPWRSVKMHVVTLPLPKALPSAVLNFTHDGPHTRVTEWKQLPAHGGNPYVTTLTFEEPCDYRDNNMERYYPVKTADRDDPNRALYRRYAAMAEEGGGVTFIGRCGMYVYTDMGPCISSSLSIVHKFLKENT
jgi:UDP-galactopyranose mutase